MKAWIAAALALLVFLAGCAGGQQRAFSVSEQGVLSYPAERSAVAFTSGGSGNVKSISYVSAGNVTIYGLLREVQDEKAAIVLLPGAGRTKEQEQELASTLAGMGYSTISLDQRGEGQSLGEGAAPLDVQYAQFLDGKEVFEYRRAYDVIRAGDLLGQLGHRKIIFMGESMGGRYALMACALDRGCAGAVGISTSGYGFGQMADANMTRFALSVDPDTYIGLIAPRKVVMVHSPSDPVIPLEMARETYLRAHEPRRFVEVECNGTHGWCTAMNAELEKQLAWVAG
ncbi:MAG: alpha/beta hydrolase [Candidatus Micrarchaeia archaeon]|jgi:hypothetical protein